MNYQIYLACSVLVRESDSIKKKLDIREPYFNSAQYIW